MEKICNTQSCTGCETCVNICPKNAIKMSLDKEGFLFPKIDKSLCIDCKLCKERCPSNKKIEEKNYSVCYAGYNKDEKIRKESSSGGVFSALAQKIIEEKGVVFGVAFDNNLDLQHIEISSKEELYKLRGSKYLQSHIGSAFKKAKEALETSKKVLFSGTPCQIQGLLSYLGKDYENLYTIDLFCHGVPSPLVFKKYMKEKKYVANTDICFRDKTYGWNNYNFKFKSFDVKNQSLNDTDTYFRGFIGNLFLRESCYNCKFNIAEYHKADISLGDFWGVEKYHPDLSDNKGTCAILINSLKGQALFDTISSMLYFKEVKIEEITNGNPVLMQPCQRPKVRNSFFVKMQKMGAIKAIEETLGINKQVAILNHSFTHDNFGALMVAYSMEKIIKSLGYQPSTIQITVPGYSKLDDFKKKFLNLTKPYKLNSNLSDLNKTFKTFIVGSDQVWRNWWNDDDIMKNFFLGFADKTKNLISYAASFGINKFKGSKELKSYIKKILKAYSSISVREEEGINICKEYFDANATLVLDPTQLIEVEEYDKIIDSENLKKPSYKYLAYMVFPNEEFDTKETQELITKLSSKLNLVTEFALKQENTMAMWLNTFKHADFVLTDSFHGMMFSIIFKKQFICLVNKLGGASRFITIAKNLGLENRIFYNLNDINIEKLINEPIEYTEIDKKLSLLRNNSIKYLQNALATNVEDNGIDNSNIFSYILSFLFYTSNKPNKKKIYLFKFIPILKIKKNNNKSKYYLFHFIPIFSKKLGL